jgi:hypothetical protein
VVSTTPRPLYSLLILYLTQLDPNSSVLLTLLNSVTDAKKLELIRRKFDALCQNSFSYCNHVSYENVLKILKLRVFTTKNLRRSALPSFLFTQETNHFIKTDSLILYGIL